MDVVDLRSLFVLIEEIEVVPPAPLPDVVATSRVGDTLEDRSIDFGPSGKKQTGKGLFDPRKHSRDGMVGQIGDQEQMHVLGHDHPRFQPETGLKTGFNQSLDEGVSDGVRREKRQALVARKGQEARLPMDLEPGAVLSMSHIFSLRG